tara:strand:- start:19 stop:939 length:921 start_codon:yes stop_codon:yes gene_type:complete
MSGDEEENIIQELNARFQELRTLMITIGSVIAMLLAGLNEVGFINFAVDTVVDWVEDDPDRNPYLPACEEDWGLVADHFVIEDDILFNVHVMDFMWCNNIHSIHYNITVDEKAVSGESPEFRNEYGFVEQIDNLTEGTHHAVIEVSNGSFDFLEIITIDFEYDEVEMQAAVYGCTNDTALNYNESATHDDGSCEYEEEEEEITEDCYAYIYDSLSYWADNNTSIYNEFDVDFSCQANITFTMQVNLMDRDNNSILDIEDNFTTYHMEWDFKYLDFYDVEMLTQAKGVLYVLYYDGEMVQELWQEVA